MSSIGRQIIQNAQAQKSQFAVLLDPDNISAKELPKIVERCHEAEVDYLFIGGSLMVSDRFTSFLSSLKKKTNLPLVLFPGSTFQVNEQADALLFLSLISGRNPELLIGQHVIAAPMLKQKDIEVIATGYMLIDGGAPTTVSYMSNSHPIPANKPDIAVCTAMAGEMLGHHLIYMDAGSGARKPIPAEIIKRVSEKIDIPLVVGGGITTPEKAAANVKAGAHLQVVGNAIEKNLSLVSEMADAIHSTR